MIITRNFILSALALGAAAASPAAAQSDAPKAGAAGRAETAAAGAAGSAGAAKAAIAAGVAVRDTQGGAVGSVARVEGEHLIVRTDRHEVRLPASSFTPVEGGLLFAMTQAQLNAEVDKAKAAADARIAPGAAVTGAAGANVGTIEAVDANFVTLKLASGGAVRVPRSGFAASDKGVVTSLTAAELEAAAKGGAAGK
jgi:preprotein translocase subunit YajC